MGTLISICRGHTAAITCCRLTAEGAGLLSGAKDNTLLIWDVVHAVAMRILVGHTAPIIEVS